MTTRFRVWDGDEMMGTFTLDDIIPAIGNDVMQYTGLDDSEGTPIYEGDIVEAMDHMDTEGDPQRVFWDENELAWATRHWFLATFDRYDLRVVGNVWEDSELLDLP